MSCPKTIPNSALLATTLRKNLSGQRSGAYRDRNNDDYRVIREAPTSIENMEDLLDSFHFGERRWEEMSDYEQISS